jgi:hypothetical protein
MAVIIVLTMGIILGIVCAPAVTEYQEASAKWRCAASKVKDAPSSWWYVGGRVKSTLLVGFSIFTVGLAALLILGFSDIRGDIGAALLVLGAVLLGAAELTRHRLIDGTGIDQGVSS